MQKRQNKLVLTGGHAATAALATVLELKKRKKGMTLHWIGTRRAVEGKNTKTLESSVLPKLGVKFHNIISGRLQRKFTFWTIPSLLKIPIGFIQAFSLLARIKPKAVLSFGGFASVPVVFAAWLMRIPVVIHEQTSAAGLANKISSKFASKIALARKESLKFFSKEKTMVVGNPILPEVAKIKPKNKVGKPPVVFVTGGSRGSQIINESVFEVLPRLLEKYMVVHQTGDLGHEKSKSLKEVLDKDTKNRYEPVSVIDPTKVHEVYKRADVVVARGGANTVAEIMSTRRPSILIPIPWSYEKEQEKNARLAQRLGLAEILKQEDLSGKTLLEALEKVIKNWPKMVVKEGSRDKKASKKLVDIVEGYLGE